MIKKRALALILAFLLLFLTACGANTDGTDGEEENDAVYTQQITLCALQSDNSSSFEQVTSPVNRRIERMGYGGSCSVSEEKVTVTLTCDHEIMRDERADIISRLCMSGDITFGDSDDDGYLTRADFTTVSCRFDERYYIDVSLNETGMEKYASLAASAYEKWQSVKNYITLCCDGEELARVTVNGRDAETDTVSFCGTLAKETAEWIVYAYEDPLPFPLTENK